ncbi:hypothetical protein RFI_07995 [Reticulomyxa filosa]|uniref:Uncharacterized protein n=1 Tax=Reticulomyxa filosa TaxID=46433 RepID=X6NTN6_RETFI|nr:hypothetical protein RFI_07995 [Reticulomyxa filosa]|eukprot:ETO29129.1 hypothetical protein RFI_07995 [Reticulomyxa filosa]
MCIQQSSGGIVQATYDDAFNGNIATHEMGHNWKMSHDVSSINDCDPTAYIMSAVGDPNGARPTQFSSCSISSVQDFFSSYTSTLSCVNNLPYATKYAVCGNGFVEQGESCDCGSSDCSTTDPCCDGELCQLYVDADCSASDVCCNNCHFKSKGTVCRQLDSSNSCDIKAETCDGESASCPADTFKIEGQSCANGTGYCYNGGCVSIENQCEVKGDLYGNGNNYVACTSYGSTTYDWKTSSCSYLKCVSGSGGQCSVLSSSVYYDKGTPCIINSSSQDLPSQCVNNKCSPSASILTYKWTAGKWDECSQACRQDDSSPLGTQNRTVSCTLQDGTVVNSSLCDSSAKPVTGQYCNDYICDFCRAGTNGENICYPNGDCNNAQQRCDCDYGYAGPSCKIIPSLTWIGVTRRMFVVNGVTHVWRADPDDKYNSSNSQSNIVTTPIRGVYSITNLTVGDTISLRWNSTGNLQSLAVGLWNRDPDSWVQYAGSGLATDNQNCTDPYLLKLECDDYSFQIPAGLIPGEYQILVRFNNEHTIYSEVLNITCSDGLCNSTGHGQCSANKTECDCSDNWFGSSCGSYLCSPWSFAKQGGDAYSDPVTFPRCVNLNVSNACLPSATSTDSLCKCNADSLLASKVAHYEGTYCEVPIDGCGGLSTSRCTGESNYCELSGSSCLYKYCAQFAQDRCGMFFFLKKKGKMIFMYLSLLLLLLLNLKKKKKKTKTGNYTKGSNHTWDCKWDSANSVCIRKTCPMQSNYPCARGSVRRPVSDTHSICDYWYCDCSTAANASTAYYKSPTASEIGSVDFTSLTPGSAEASMLTCNMCTLNCQNGGSQDPYCTSCGDCPSPWGGVQCDKKYWVISMRLKVDWQTAYAYKAEEFASLFEEDMAFVINVSPSRLEIWQLKGDNGGTIVYWKYIFSSGDDTEAQAEGGNIFIGLQKMVAKNGSPQIYIRILCAEQRECDPNQQFHYTEFFIISICVSFAFHLLALAVYRFTTRKKRRERYEAKLREVREHQKRTMEQHARARRVGLKDVSKSRASQIHQAKQEKKKLEEKELKDREKEIERRLSVQKHQPKPSSEQLAQRRSSHVDSVSHESAHAQPPPPVNPGAGLPEGWQVFYNENGIPYYYNVHTGITSWRHPNS